MLNLRLTTERAKRLGVHGHVCELQLVLRSFEERKVPPNSLPQSPATPLVSCFPHRHPAALSNCPLSC